MKTLRTPIESFADAGLNVDDIQYADVDDQAGGLLRIAYRTFGSPADPVVVMLHGEPTWSYLYRKVASSVADEGYFVITPDLVGFGHSDKPTEIADHTYLRHVNWIRSLLFDALDLRDVTLVGQDWGGLIGLRLVAEDTDRFRAVVVANTGLPTGDHGMPEVWLRFREAVKTAPTLDVARLVDSGCVHRLSREVRAAYDAPFPSEEFKAGPRAMPGLVPTSPDDPATNANRAAWEVLSHLPIPTLVAFSDSDPITGAMGPIFRKLLPGAADRSQPVITNAGHFLQEDNPVQLADEITKFLKSLDRDSAG